MPLIVITGIPCSGKTTRALEMKHFFEEQGKEVHIVSEIVEIIKAGFEKNTFYNDSNKEKHVRGLLKSEMLKLITQNNIVILDALNYIKGYRYELFCGTKANKCLQCTVQTEINRDQAWQFNLARDEVDQYNRETFDALNMRYEEPIEKNRWDSPLFMVFPDNDLNMTEIYNCLFKKKPPKPNMSTQNPPLSSTNFLYELDKVTKDIVDDIVAIINKGEEHALKVKGFGELKFDLNKVSVPELQVLRRQYISYSKMRAPDPEDIPRLFAQYLLTFIK